MDFISYLYILQLNSGLYLMILGISLIICYFLLRKQMFSMIDPMIMIYFHMSIWITTVAFMYALDLIENIFLYHFFISSVMFIIGINIFSSEKKKIADIINQNQYDNKFKDKILLMVFTAMYIIIKLYLFLKYGTPVLAGEETANFYKGSIYLLRMADVFFLITMFYLIEKMACNKLNVFDKATVVFLFLDLLLSGFKGNFFILFMGVNIYYHFFKLEKFFKKKVVPIIFGLFIFILCLKNNFDLTDVLTMLEISIANRGDTLVLFYGARYDDIMSYYNEYSGMLPFVYEHFRMLVTELGFITPGGWFDRSASNTLLMEYVYGRDFIIKSGPNDIYNVYSLAYLGIVGSAIYSFVLGGIISFIRNKLIHYINLNILFHRLIFWTLELEVIYFTLWAQRPIADLAYMLISVGFGMLVMYYIDFLLNKKVSKNM